MIHQTSANTTITGLLCDHPSILLAFTDQAIHRYVTRIKTESSNQCTFQRYQDELWATKIGRSTILLSISDTKEGRKQSTAIFCWSKFWSWLLQTTHMTHKLLPLVETRLPLAIDNTLYYLSPCLVTDWLGKQTRAVVTGALTKILENTPIRPIVPEINRCRSTNTISLISAGPMARTWLEYKGQANCSCTYRVVLNSKWQRVFKQLECYIPLLLHFSLLQEFMTSIEFLCSISFLIVLIAIS